METIKETFIGLWDNYTITSDARLDFWFMMDSMWYPNIIVALYLFGALYVGPAIMSNFDRFELRWVLDMFYNPIVCIYNFCIGALLVWYMRDANYSLVCQRLNTNGGPKEDRIACMIWVFQFFKLSTFLDTLIRILRKDQLRVLGLQIFHHATMYYGVWLAARFVPGGTTVILLAINCWAHWMLYAINTLHFRLGFNLLAGYWCAVMEMELIQFGLIGFICLWNILTGCPYPTIVSIIVLIYVVCLASLVAPNWLRKFPHDLKRIQKEKEK